MTALRDLFAAQSSNESLEAQRTTLLNNPSEPALSKPFKLFKAEPAHTLQPTALTQSESTILEEHPLTDAELAKLKELATKSFWHFCLGVMGNDWLYEPLHKELCVFMQKPGLYKAITLPRSFLKTTITLMYALWYLVRHPGAQVLIVTNNDDNAIIKGGELRTMVERAPILTRLWPELTPNSKWSGSGVVLKGAPTGHFSIYLIGMGADVTGTHWDLVIEDDTLTLKKDKMSGIEMIPSPEDVQKAIGFHMSVTHLRKTPACSQIVVVGTRWALADLFAYIYEKEPHYGVFERRAWVEREDGSKTAVYPQRGNGQSAFPIEELLRIQQQNPYLFSTLYLNSPLDPTKQIFKKEHLKYFKKKPTNVRTFILVDPAYSLNKAACDTAIMAVSLAKNGDWYVGGYQFGRMTPNEIISRSVDMAVSHKAEVIAPENVAAQVFLFTMLEQEMLNRGVWFTLSYDVKPGHSGKRGRIPSMQPMFAQRKVWLLAEGMTELESQLLSYPLGAKVDLIDALSFMTYFSRPVGVEVPGRVVDEFDRLFGFEAIINELEEKAHERHLSEWGYDDSEGILVQSLSA